MSELVKYCRTTQLNKEEVSNLSQLLTEAFIYDPTYQFISPIINKRYQNLPYFFQALINYTCFYGCCYILKNQQQQPHAIALLLPPNKKFINPIGLVKAKTLFPMCQYITKLLFCPSSLIRFIRIVNHVDRIQKKYDPTGIASYVITFAVVAKDRQKGLGSKLLKILLSEQARQSLYLETQNPNNCQFYLRHKFQALGSHPLSSTVMTYAFRYTPNVNGNANVERREASHL